MPLFSVIVPVYNMEAYIVECIESIINQTFKNFELILVDDGSEDSCPVICDEYEAKDNRIKVIHKTNEGVSIARETGVKNASGSFLVFVDSDDWLDETCFEKYYNEIEMNNPDIIFSGFYFGNNNNRFFKHTYSDEKRIFDRCDIIKKLFPILIESDMGDYFASSVCGMTIKKNLYIENHVKSSYIDIGEDSAVVKPCIYNANSIVILDTPFYYYRFNQKSATKGGKTFDWYGPEKIGKHIEKHIPMTNDDFQNQLNRNIVHNLFNVCVSQFYRKESYYIICKDIKKHLSEDCFPL